MLFFISVIVCIIPGVAASAGIFDIFNLTEYKGSLDIITEYPDPEKIVQSEDHIRGWIDIVGFNHTVRLNNTEYRNHSQPKIEYELWDEGLIWNDNFDWMKVTDERFITENNNTTAEIDIHLLWHRSTLKSRTVCGKNGCRTYTWIHKDYYNEYATFSDTVETPEQYPDINDSAVSIIIYNNSFNPHVDIHVPVQQFETKTVYSYQDETITRISKVGFASTGAVNLSECLQWEDESDMFAYRNEKAILRNFNKSVFNPSKLKITTHTPYASTDRTNYYVSVEEFDETGGIGNGLLTPISLLIIFGIGIKKCFSGLGDLI